MLILCLILVAILTTPLMACSCRRFHPQEHFCRDDYALRIKVVGSLKVDRSDKIPYTPGILRFEKIYYPIRIIKVYKGNISSLTHLETLRRHNSKVRYISRLYVPSRISSCRLSLTKTRVYVVMGQIHEGVLHHGLCNWRSTWRHLTSVQLSGLKRQYAKGCECSIRTCPTRKWCKKSQLPTECRWVSEDGFGVTKCVDRWQVCKYNGDSRSCKWRQPEQPNFTKCVNEVRWP